MRCAHRHLHTVWGRLWRGGADSATSRAALQPARLLHGQRWARAETPQCARSHLVTTLVKAQLQFLQNYLEFQFCKSAIWPGLKTQDLGQKHLSVQGSSPFEAHSELGIHCFLAPSYFPGYCLELARSLQSPTCHTPSTPLSPSHHCRGVHDMQRGQCRSLLACCSKRPCQGTCIRCKAAFPFSF